jgi:hypothetical protein
MAIRSGDDGGGPRGTWPTVTDRGYDGARGWWAFVQAVANVAWPLAAYVTLVPYVGGTELEGWARIVGGYAFLPLIFVGLMQIVSLSEVVPSARDLQVGLLAPLALFAATLAWRPVDAVRMVFEVGALYLSALMLAFAWIVVVRPFASGLVWGWSWRQRGTYVLMALAQGVFLGPGLAAAALFGWVLLRGMGTDAGPPGPVAWVGYLAALGILTRHELRWMGRAAGGAP